MPELLRTEAVILHGMRWSDTSKIVHLFTEQKGNVKAIARGAMRPKSALRGVTENLNHVELILSLKETRGLQIVSQADLLNSFGRIRENLEATAVAYAILELLRNLVHYNEDVRILFKDTIALLKGLNHLPSAHSLLFLLKFQLLLSEHLGFGWNISQCRRCKKRPGTFPVGIDTINGSVFCREHAAPQLSKLRKDQYDLLLDLQQTPSVSLPDMIHTGSYVKYYQNLLDHLLRHLNYHTEQNLQLSSLKMYHP
jgi:DNA repair protein RecO